MSEHIQELSEAGFDESVLKSDKPVLVDFWAVWCGPCRQVSPIVDAIATKWADRVKVGKLNVDDHPGIAERYQVMSIPTLMLFKNGQVVERVIGLAPQSSLEKKFEPHIS